MTLIYRHLRPFSLHYLIKWFCRSGQLTETLSNLSMLCFQNLMRHHVFCRTSRVLHFHGQASAVVFRNYYNDRSCFQSSSDSGNFEGIALFRFSCERTNLFIRKFRGYVLHVAFPHKRHASNFLLFKSTMGYNIVMRKITWSVDERDLHFSPVCFRTRLSYNRLNQSPFTPPSQIFISYSVDSSV